MALMDAIIGPVAKLIDKIIPDPQARDQRPHISRAIIATAPPPQNIPPAAASRP